MKTRIDKHNSIEKLQPNLRFPEFEGEWEMKKLGEVINFKVTNSFSRENLNYEKGVVKNIHYGDIHTKFQTLFDITKESVPYVNEEISIGRISEDNYCKEGDIIFADASEDINDVGKSIEIKNLNGERLLSGLHTLLGRPMDSKFIIGFNGYLFKSNNIRLQIQKESQGSKVLSINVGRILGINLSFPSLPEQQKIASFLTAVDNKLHALKQKHALLEQYKKGVMQKIFAQELRFKDENGNDYPDWEEKKLGEVMSIRNEQASKSDQYPLMAFIQNIGVAPKGERYNREFLVNDGESKKYKKTEYGDFIYSSNNLETGSIGLNRYGSASISPVYSIFHVKQSINFEFISTFLVRKNFINKMIKFRQGVVYGQWKIHESEFLKIQESIPCIAEQTKIAAFLSTLDEKINQCQAQIAKTEVWKKGLLQKMFV